MKNLYKWRPTSRWHVVTIILFFSITTTIFAWGGHFSLTYVALKNTPEISHEVTIPAETLTAFLQKERLGLVKFLQENEAWSEKNVPLYPPLPQELVFKGDESKPLKMQFVEAIRINPTLNFPLFVQYPPNVEHRIHGRPLKRKDVMLPDVAKDEWARVPNPPLEGVLPGEKVSPLEIITSASAEPDYGMDMNLWENSPSWFAKEDHWGPQPFGDPTLSLTSQAPFHMAFYYESPLLYKAAPFLKYSYLEYRLHLYLTLSQYAFQSGHPYWGYRFLGWSIHYAQDLTQPYHTTAVPNASVARLITAALLNRIGFRSPQRNLIQLVSNRHFTLENYTYYAINHFLETNQKHNALIQALKDKQQDAQYPAYTEAYPRTVIAKESHAVADRLDKEIRKAFPKKYVADPKYIFHQTETNINLFDIMKDHHQNKNWDSFNNELASLLRAFGAHTRNIVRYVLSSSAH